MPLVLKTSFNRHGLPMVSTPRQAISHLLEGAIDSLAIEGLVVRRPGGRRPDLPTTPETKLLAQMRAPPPQR